MLLGPALMYSANTIFLTVFALFFVLRIAPISLVALAPCRSPASLSNTSAARFTTGSSTSRPASPTSPRGAENYSGVRLIRAFAREDSQISLFERLNRQYIGRALRLVQLMGMLWPALEFILGISLIITLFAGGHQVLAHKITVGQFFAYSTYRCCSRGPSSPWAGSSTSSARHRFGQRIDELLKAEPEIDNRFADPAIPADCTLSGDIEFRHLSFSYDDAYRHEPIPARHLAAHSRRLKPTAIVGPTG